MVSTKEMETSFHIVILCAFTIMCGLFSVIDLISGWNRWAILYVVFLIIFCWTLHIFEIFRPKVRLYIYVISVLSILGFYAYQPETITDIPILLCLLIIILSRQNDPFLVVLTFLSYLVFILENIFITGFLTPDTPQIVFSRIALGFFCLLLAAVFATYFMLSNRNNQEEKEALIHEVDAAHKETDHFLSNMSHELRTPINVVCGMSELMLNNETADSKEGNLTAILSAGKRMQRQVNNILSYSELQSDHFSLSKSNFEPLSLVNDVVNNVFSGNPKKLDFIVDVDPMLPKTLYGDEKNLSDVLFCLIDNAVKFTKEGGGRIYISARKESYGVNLNIDVNDTGTGIKPDSNDRLFKGIYAAETGSRRSHGGLGLGLTVSHGIVSNMGGFVNIDSNKRGSHIHVTVPQKIVNQKPSISLSNAQDFYVLSFIDKGYEGRAEIKQYYLDMLDHLKKRLSINVCVAESLDEVIKNIKSKKFTHIFLSEWEYAINPDYFENIAKKFPVLLWAGEGFSCQKGSSIHLLKKPISTAAAVNFLEQTKEVKEEAGNNKKTDEAIITVGKKALIVDDEKMNLMVAKGILKKFFISSDTAVSGQAAIDLCKVNKYDIIFMDYMMPEMNGTEAMNAIRKLNDGYYENIPIVILTANAVSGAREEFMNEGFDDFLSKPVNIKSMEKVLFNNLKGESVNGSSGKSAN